MGPWPKMKSVIILSATKAKAPTSQAGDEDHAQGIATQHEIGGQAHHIDQILLLIWRWWCNLDELTEHVDILLHLRDEFQHEWVGRAPTFEHGQLSV